MATFNANMNRNTAANRTALEVPEKRIAEVIKDVEATSVAMQLGQVHQMSTFQERLIVQNSQPTAYWLNGTTANGDNPPGNANNDDTNQAAKDSALKQTTSYGYDSLVLRTDEIAVMVIMPDAWRDDARLAWEQVRVALRGAFAKSIDAAIFWGTSPDGALPSTFGPGLVPSTIAEGNIVDLSDFGGTAQTDGTRDDRADAYAATAQLIDSKGYRATDFVVQPGETWNLKRQRDANGAILGADGLFGLSVTEVRNGTWDSTEAVALTGEFDNLVIGVRQGLTFSLSNSATLTNNSGVVQYSAFQQDGEVLRAVMRLGYVVKNPLMNLTGEREFPFAALVPGPVV